MGEAAILPLLPFWSRELSRSLPQSEMSYSKLLKEVIEGILWGIVLGFIKGILGL